MRLPARSLATAASLLVLLASAPRAQMVAVSSGSAAAALELPTVPREFRGVWVATVGNMDWPTSREASVAEQQAELLAMLDRAQRLNLNAVIFQVRPAADALYDSPYEPWSHILTGVQGKAPEPYWDPLRFAITEAHRRGLELHAWFNPFRAGFVNATSPAARNHVTRRRPELVRRYGPYLWLDPGEKAAQDLAIQVVRDVVRRYDVDGVHIDDYFYPYRERDRRGRTIPFPDDATYERYRRNGGRLSRDDWRRQNVDRFVERLYREVHAEKPWVKVGISPFGIWRPGHPEQIEGLDAYQEIYADARKWVRNGWLDYVAPQLYWTVDQYAQSYPVLLRWWIEQNLQGRHVWPGNYTSRVGDPRMSRWTPAELERQVEVTRRARGASGNVHFSMSAFMQDRAGLGPRLATGVYAEPALVPPSPWLAPQLPPLEARVTRDPSPVPADALGLHLDAADPSRVSRWIVRARYGQQWRVHLVPGVQRSYVLGTGGQRGAPDLVVVSAVDRRGVEGPPAVLPVVTEAVGGA